MRAVAHCSGARLGRAPSSNLTSPHLCYPLSSNTRRPVQDRSLLPLDCVLSSPISTSRFCPAPRAAACIVAGEVSLTASTPSARPNHGDVGHLAPLHNLTAHSLERQYPAASPHQAFALAQSATSLMHPALPSTFSQPILLTLPPHSTTLLRTTLAA